MNRIAVRLAAAMMPAVVAVLVIFGLASALREAEVIVTEMQRDVSAMAVIVAELLSPAEDLAAARERLATMEIGTPELDFELSLVEQDPAGSGVGADATADDFVTGRGVVRGADGQPLGVLLVREPLSARDAFLERALLMDALGVLAATLMAFVFAVGVGRVLVQKRVLALVERLDAVGRGEIRDRPMALGDDELGTIGQAVEHLSHQLSEARLHGARQEAERRRAQLQLHRADRLTAVGRMVAVFAHEIGTPLAVIAGRAERIQRADCSERVMKDADIIQTQAERITSFTRRVLDHARHDDGFDLSPCALEGVVRHAMALVESRAEAAQVSLLVTATPGGLWVDGDAQRLEQVARNLLENAVDASPPGGEVRLGCGEEGCAEVDLRGMPEHHVHLWVEDQGPGIPEDLRPRVFDPFFSTKGAGGGTGLGLSIVDQIVRDHGGFVTLGDAPGGGCRVVVHLPLLRRPHA